MFSIYKVYRQLHTIHKRGGNLMKTYFCLNFVMIYFYNIYVVKQCLGKRENIFSFHLSDKNFIIFIVEEFVEL